MKISHTLFALAAVAMVGCGQKASESTSVTAPLESAFKESDTPAATSAANGPLPTGDATGTLRDEIVRAQNQLRTRDYPEAVLSLQKIQRATNLTASQIAAVNETMARVQSHLIEKAAAGDQRAKKAIEDFQNNLTR